MWESNAAPVGTPDAVNASPSYSLTSNEPGAHVGDVGIAQRVKLINNAMMAAHMALAVHALELADAFGVDRATVASTIHHGSGQSRALDLLAQLGLRRELIPDQAIQLLRKDIQLVLGLDRTQGKNASIALA